MRMTRQTIGDSGDDFPHGIGNLARRVLIAAGYQRLEQLTSVTEREIGQLHGVGPRAPRELRRALMGQGQSFTNGERAQDGKRGITFDDPRGNLTP